MSRVDVPPPSDERLVCQKCKLYDRIRIAKLHRRRIGTLKGRVEYLRSREDDNHHRKAELAALIWALGILEPLFVNEEEKSDET